MRITVCELPHEPRALAAAWAALCEHTARHSSELVLLPEFAMVDPIWVHEHFDAARWADTQALSEVWRHRLPELRASHVVGTRPVTIAGRHFNQGFLWSASGGLEPLRRKFYLPDEPGNWEARWFDRGDSDFTNYAAGACRFGLNICTELWALETYAGYAARGVPVILSPRATAAATTTKWLSVGVVAAVRSGAFCLSSNRVEPTGACGGVGWVIDPYGNILARTTADAPFATVDIDLSSSAVARADYPGYVLRDRRNDRDHVRVW
ncbi:MAG TPA: carbon-nitrogen hydrolase family protein [Thermoanaerobaculia bacterium]|jgi:N-carbamoylputrescine amidase|nr:carbon-nitrogen hydrolase family protein [Thermoanaerobaculia bacterium]